MPIALTDCDPDTVIGVPRLPGHRKPGEAEAPAEDARPGGATVPSADSERRHENA